MKLRSRDGPMCAPGYLPKNWKVLGIFVFVKFRRGGEHLPKSTLMTEYDNLNDHDVLFLRLVLIKKYVGLICIIVFFKKSKLYQSFGDDMKKLYADQNKQR